MKKLLNISVIAALAVLPMAANANVGDVVGTGTTPVTANPQPATEQAKAAVMAGAPYYSLATQEATDNNLATAGYVKGAYNAAIKAVNGAYDAATSAKDQAKTYIEGRLETDDPATNGYDINAKTLNVNGATTMSSTLDVTGATTLSDDLTVGGDASVAGTLGVTGAATFGDNVTLTSGKTVTATGVTISGATLSGGSIDASSTDISNLDTEDFASGVIVTTVGDTGSDTSLATEKAVRTAITTAVNGINGDSTVADGRVIRAANSVSANLTALDTAVANIQDTNIPVMTTWGNGTATNYAIKNLTAGTVPAAVPSGE